MNDSHPEMIYMNCILCAGLEMMPEISGEIT